jgi:SAM-dependent methyltransferase
VLRRFATDWDADGWLGMHPLHVLGTSSWRALLGERGGVLLDVGAGRGDVTSTLAPLFERVVATETSAPMVRRLRARGFEAHGVDLATEPLPGAGRFAAVAMLHVLDRCARPRTLLARAIDHLAQDGVAIVAVPLPARPHVDAGRYTVDPDEPLDADGATFEEALGRFAERVLAPAGLEVLRWTRATYYARGDARSPMHALDDAIVVARRR